MTKSQSNPTTSNTSDNPVGSVTPRDDFEDDTVIINMVLCALIDRLTAEERRPINESNMIDVQDFHNKLANLLFKCPSDGEDTGHASVVQTLDGHRDVVSRTGPMQRRYRRPRRNQNYH